MMGNPVFPTELPMPDLPLEQQYEDPGTRTDVKDGPAIGWRRFTKRRLKYVVLNWSVTPLTKDQYTMLQNFLDLIGGSAVNFQWTHPVTGELYTDMYIIDQGTDRFGADGNETWSGGITIGEA